MTELKDLLDREAARVHADSASLTDVYERAARRRPRRRLAIGASLLLVAALGVGGYAALDSFTGQRRSSPAGPILDGVSTRRVSVEGAEIPLPSGWFLATQGSVATDTEASGEFFPAVVSSQTLPGFDSTITGSWTPTEFGCAAADGLATDHVLLVLFQDLDPTDLGGYSSWPVTRSDARFDHGCFSDSVEHRFAAGGRYFRAWLVRGDKAPTARWELLQAVFANIRFPEDGWRGLWPQTSREAAERAQAEAADSRSIPWQAVAGMVIDRYATVELGWDRAIVSADDLNDAEGRGPVSARVGDCADMRFERCDREVTVTVERLLRTDDRGLWFVVASEPTDLPPPRQGRLEATPDEGPPGTTIAVSGDGCLTGIHGTREPGDQTRVAISGPDGAEQREWGSGEYVVDESGGWQTQMTVTRDAPPGTYEIRAACLSQGQIVTEYPAIFFEAR